MAEHREESREFASSPVRASFRVADWGLPPPEAGSAAARAVEALPNLRSLSVKAWARTLGCSPLGTYDRAQGAAPQ